MKDVPSSTDAQLDKIEKKFVRKNGNPKLKQTTLCNEYEKGVLKSVDIFFEITSLRCTWVKILYDDSFHAWKVVPSFFIQD